MPSKRKRLSVAIPDTKYQRVPVTPYSYTYFEEAPRVRTVLVVLCLGVKVPKSPCWFAMREILAEGMPRYVFSEVWVGVRFLADSTDEQLERAGSGVPKRGVMMPVTRSAPLSDEQGPFRRHDRPGSPRLDPAGVRSIYVMRGARPGECGALFTLDRTCCPARDVNNAGLLFVSHPSAQGGAMLAAKMISTYNSSSGGGQLQGARLTVCAPDFAGVPQPLRCDAQLVDLRETFARTGVSDMAFV